MPEKILPTMKRLTAYVYGKIQEAGYRSRVVTVAKALNLKGCVQNLPDGSVKIIAEGDERDLERFLKAIDVKNALINVERIDHEFSEPTGGFDDFYKLVGEGETDERLDKAAEYLKELIGVTKNGFGEVKDELISVKSEMRAGFTDLKNVVIVESEKTRGVIVEESEKTREELGRKIEEVGNKVDIVGTKVEEVGNKVDLLRMDMKEFIETNMNRMYKEISEIKQALKKAGIM